MEILRLRAKTEKQLQQQRSLTTKAGWASEVVDHMRTRGAPVSYLGEAPVVLAHHRGVGAVQLLDDLKALVELGEDVYHWAGEQSMLGRRLELGDGKQPTFLMPVHVNIFWFHGCVAACFIVDFGLCSQRDRHFHTFEIAMSGSEDISHTESLHSYFSLNKLIWKWKQCPGPLFICGCGVLFFSLFEPFLL